MVTRVGRRIRMGRWSALLAVAALTAAACGSDSDGDSTEGDSTLGIEDTTSTEPSSSVSGEPGTADESGTRVVDTPMGDVEIPSDPQRIVVLWRPTMASMLQLGVDPIATLGGAGGDPQFLQPYYPEGYPIDDVEIIGEVREINFEALAAQEPDLILGAEVPFLTDAYDRLSDIAPTVLPTWDGTTSWQTMLLDVAEVLGIPERADQVVADYEAHLDEVRELVDLEANPQTVTLVRIQSAEEVRIETPASFPGQILAEVGFDRPENQLQPDVDADFISLSLERIPELDAPTIIAAYYFGDDVTSPAWEQVQDSGLWQALPAAESGDIVEVDYLYWGGSNYYSAHRILDDIAEAFGQ